MSGIHPIVRLLLAVSVLVGLAVLGAGLLKIVQFERTPTAVADIRTGEGLVIVGCVLLVVCAAVTVVLGPRWAGMAIAAPAVVCGVLVIFAAGTLFPQIAALPMFVLAAAGAVAVLLSRG